MLERIREILKGYEPLKDRYITTEALPLCEGAVSLRPVGDRKEARRYTDGGSVVSLGFSINCLLTDGINGDGDNRNFMQGVADYLSGYSDEGIVGFEQVAPTEVEHRNSAKSVYSIRMTICYIG